MNGHMDLPTIWYCIMGVLLWLYVLTDGFDLGVGVLCLLTKDEARCDAMVETIESVWHANQTWLVMLGGVLFGAFPVVYGTILVPLYLPAGLLLFAFMARGIGLELRGEAKNKRPWTLLFGWGSLAVILAHGFLIGAILQGMPFSGQTYQGGAWDWISPFTLLVCLTFICLYVTLAAAWLVLKTGGDLETSARRWGRCWGLATLAVLVVVILYSGFAGHLDHLVGQPGAALAPGFVSWIVAAVVMAILFFRALATGGQGRPFFWCAVMLACVFLGFGTNLFPLVVPPHLTAAQAASPTDMLRIMLLVVGSLFPVLVIYNIYQYRVFRGKVVPHSAADAS